MPALSYPVLPSHAELIGRDESWVFSPTTMPIFSCDENDDMDIVYQSEAFKSDVVVPVEGCSYTLPKIIPI